METITLNFEHWKIWRDSRYSYLVLLNILPYYGITKEDVENVEHDFSPKIDVYLKVGDEDE